MDFKIAAEIADGSIAQLNWNISPVNLYDPIAYILENGGKRIRPALVLMAYSLFKPSHEPAINAAMAIEVFHNFTLLHDDIMDKAPIRRNRPTVHTKWNENTAILSGDAMMIKAFEFIAKTPKETMSLALDEFTKVAIEVCEGQQFDMEFETKTDVSVEQYLEMIRLKTAVLLAASLKIGAIIAKADDADAQKLYNFGINIGLAFQLQDDLLDTFGDEKTFGKTIGGDIVENKKTFLMLTALSIADNKQKEQLLSIISESNFDRDTKIETVKSIFTQLNIASITQLKMNFYYDLAIESLESLSVNADEKEPLKQLALLLMDRTK